MSTKSSIQRRDRTIDDFGRQWLRYPTRDWAGYAGSRELFADYIHPILSLEDFRGKTVADLGSGTGRIVQMLHLAGAKKIFAVEPSASMSVVKRNTTSIRDKVEYLQMRGDQLPPDLGLDFVVSLGVIHHIPEPDPVIAASFRALAPGGRIVVWLYGHEGNEAYLAVAEPLRRITTRLPDTVLAVFTWLLWPLLEIYLALAKMGVRLPMKGYVTRVLGKVPSATRRAIMYDQLNPTWARYYREDEARQLIERAGFEDVKLHHRHGYSWMVVGTKPPVSTSST